MNLKKKKKSKITENAKQTEFLPNPQKLWEISYAVEGYSMLVPKREGLDLIPLRKNVNS